MMRKLLGMGVVAAMLFVATAASAAGVNLSWNDCQGDGGVANRTSACAANTGTNILTTSFILPADLAQVSGNELVLDVLTAQPTLPAWWEFRDPGTCRTTSLGFNVLINPADVNCIDWAQGQSAGGIGAYNSELGSIDGALVAQHRRIKIALAVPVSGLQNLTAGTEYFSCNLTVNNAKTVGPVACAGCDQPMCIVFNSINITTPVSANNVFIGTANSNGSNIVTWQGAGPNCLAVPVQNKTWGQVKALYR